MMGEDLIILAHLHTEADQNIPDQHHSEPDLTDTGPDLARSHHILAIILQWLIFLDFKTDYLKAPIRRSEIANSDQPTCG